MPLWDSHVLWDRHALWDEATPIDLAATITATSAAAATRISLPRVLSATITALSTATGAVTIPSIGVNPAILGSVTPLAVPGAVSVPSLTILFQTAAGDAVAPPAGCTFTIERTSHSIAGGPVQMDVAVELTADASVDLLDALLGLLTQPVCAIDQTAEQRWWGYVHEVEIVIAGASVVMSMDRFASAVFIQYRPPDAQSGETALLRGYRPEAQTRYGYKVLIDDVGERSAVQVQQRIDSLLAERSIVRTQHRLTSTRAGASARLTCLGWGQTIGWNEVERLEYTDWWPERQEALFTIGSFGFGIETAYATRFVAPQLGTSFLTRLQLYLVRYGTPDDEAVPPEVEDTVLIDFCDDLDNTGQQPGPVIYTVTVDPTTIRGVSRPNDPIDRGRVEAEIASHASVITVVIDDPVWSGLTFYAGRPVWIRVRRSGPDSPNFGYYLFGISTNRLMPDGSAPASARTVSATTPELNDWTGVGAPFAYAMSWNRDTLEDLTIQLTTGRAWVFRGVEVVQPAVSQIRIPMQTELDTLDQMMERNLDEGAYLIINGVLSATRRRLLWNVTRDRILEIKPWPEPSEATIERVPVRYDRRGVPEALRLQTPAGMSVANCEAPCGVWLDDSAVLPAAISSVVSDAVRSFVVSSSYDARTDTVSFTAADSEPAWE